MKYFARCNKDKFQISLVLFCCLIVREFESYPRFSSLGSNLFLLYIHIEGLSYCFCSVKIQQNNYFSTELVLEIMGPESCLNVLQILFDVLIRKPWNQSGELQAAYVSKVCEGRARTFFH